MKFLLLSLLTFLMAPVAASIVGGLIYFLVHNPMMWFVLVGGIVFLGRYCR